jgi:NAD(P)-dependent dehydrogenase (short-subunit alcohol dehydrogenase family)
MTTSQRNGPRPGTSLSDKVAIVTGGGRGLGRAEAVELARQGAAVVVNDFGVSVDGRSGAGDSSPAKQVVAEILAAGGEAVAHEGDVADTDDVRALFDLTLETYGNVDILVNNAGILRDRMIFSMSDAEWDDVIRVHLRGHFLTCRAATAHWRARSKAAGGPVYARIVNTSSEAFLAGSPGQPNYAAAKAGITALTLSVAAGCGRYGVRANAICPRALTRMTEHVFSPDAGTPDATPPDVLDPLAPEHVAPLVAYLASPAAESISGQLFVVHGGMVAVVAAPQVAAKFDSQGTTWTPEELDDMLTHYFADGEPGAGFTAAGILSLRRSSVEVE